MATHPHGPVPAPVLVLTCHRCGFSWEHVRRPGGQPVYCTECRPLVIRQRNAVWGDRKHPASYLRQKRARERLDRRGLTHAWKGLTEQQWVDRWSECPWLFEKLVRAIEVSVDRYPDWREALALAA